MKQFNMIYQNDIAKLYIKKSCEQEKVFCSIQLLPVNTLSISQARKTSAQLSEIYKLAEKLSALIETNSLVDTVKRSSYKRNEDEVFTPFYCLEQFYCLGVNHTTGALKVVSYGELFNEYEAVSRDDCMLKIFESLVAHNKKFTDIDADLH